MYNIIYESEGEKRFYCSEHGSLFLMQKMLRLFKDRYLFDDGSPKPFPNGKGFYNVSNPQIVRIS